MKARQALASLLTVVLAVIAAWLAGAAWTAAHADTLDDIRQRGVLVVGVKRDVPLWGFEDPATGRLAGLEPDLAADLAERLGVRLQLVGLLSAERLEALEHRRVDLLLATLSDTPERRTRMTMVLPHYYASGVNILARRQAGFQEWSDLRNRRVCGRRGAFYNRSVTVSAGVDVVALYDNSLAISALRDGRCDALLYDDTSIVALLRDPAWARDFEMPLPTLFVTPWAIGIHRDDAGSRLENFLSQSVIAWHRSGRITELERKWGIPVTAFSTRMAAAWRKRSGDGYLCGHRLSADTPKECL
jgi:polar amino acid transport system substrate-binding protein